eukprot:CAMPEP_0197072862 /NCGR_PEP_ID=MMETSP1384-20130603/210311_1 /TAXON_ID=29189 /ORGANISM="Ammonia sp." /LENGTH=429 /DNA_ID=CAMNT_0042511683 /DNA_START=27 /DNA_END=1316 /DNA_ORIENTATION=+
MATPISKDNCNNRSNPCIQQLPHIQTRTYHAYSASMDSNNPTLPYDEYDSDSSRDEELYSFVSDTGTTPNGPCDLYVQQTKSSSHPLNHQHNASALNTHFDFHVTDIHYVPSPETHNRCLPRFPPNNDEKEQLKLENEALRKQNEYLRHQYHQHINSPVSAPVLSTMSHYEIKQDVDAPKRCTAFSSHAPSQSITDEILFEFVTLSDEEYAVDISAQNNKTSKQKKSKHNDDQTNKKKKRKKVKSKRAKRGRCNLRHCIVVQRLAKALKWYQKYSGDAEKLYLKLERKKKRKKVKSKRRKSARCNLRHCIAIQRLAKALKWYQKYSGDAEKLYLKLERKEYVEYLLSDYQHVLDAHSCDLKSQRIHTALHQKCDADSCLAVHRVISNEVEGDGDEGNMVSVQSRKDKVEFYAHSMDLIHCYLLHLDCFN